MRKKSINQDNQREIFTPEQRGPRNLAKIKRTVSPKLHQRYLYDGDSDLTVEMEDKSPDPNKTGAEHMKHDNGLSEDDENANLDSDNRKNVLHHLRVEDRCVSNISV